MTRPLMHRMGSNPAPLCGATGPVRLSTSGVFITCPVCEALSKGPTREEALRQLSEAAARFRERHPKVTP